MLDLSVALDQNLIAVDAGEPAALRQLGAHVITGSVGGDDIRVITRDGGNDSRAVHLRRLGAAVGIIKVDGQHAPQPNDLAHGA